MKKIFTSIIHWVLVAVMLLLGTAQPVFADLSAQTDGPVIESLPERPLYGPEAALAMNWATPPVVEGGQIEWSGVPWSEMVYQNLDTTDMDWDLWMTYSTGNTTYRLKNTPYHEIRPKLNRGISQVVYLRVNGSEYDIFKYDLPTGAIQQLTFTPTEEMNPGWSPDGRKIVYESYQDGQAEIYVMNADGSAKTRLTYSAGGADYDYDGMPSWSPDGTQIAFVSKRTGGYRVWIMNADGTDPYMVTTKPYSSYPTWKPDGSEIIFSGDAGNDGFYGVYKVDLNTFTESGVIREYYRYDYWPAAYSPNGAGITVIRVEYIDYNGEWYWRWANVGLVDEMGAFSSIIIPSSEVWNADWQTSDTIPPTASLAALPAVSPAPPKPKPSVYDGQSGIYTYVIEERQGLYGEWKVFGEAPHYFGGETYYYRITAYDNGYNVDTNPNYDAVTTIEALSPVSYLNTLPEYTKEDELILDWGGYDLGGTGISSYTVQVRNGNDSTWTNWYEGAGDTPYNYPGTAGEIYHFRVAAVDGANNQEEWTDNPNGDASTTVYYRSVEGRVFTNTGTPVINASVITTPDTMNDTSSNRGGNYLGYFGTSASNPFNLSWSKPEYGLLPVTSFNGNADIEIDAYLPPVNNSVSNWGFENHLISWSPSGPFAPVSGNTYYHTGVTSAVMGYESSLTPPMAMPALCNRIMVSATGSNNEFHVLCEGMYYFVYQNGSWSSPVQITTLGITENNGLKLLAGDNGIAHVFYRKYDGPKDSIYHLMRDPSGTWTSPTSIYKCIGYTSCYFKDAILDSDSQPHILVSDFWDVDSSLVYLRRWQNGGWSSPEGILYSRGEGFIKLTQDNRPVIFYSFNVTDYMDRLYVTEKLTNGSWKPPILFDEGSGISIKELVSLPDGGNIAIWARSKNEKWYLNLKRQYPSGSWSKTYESYPISYFGGVTTHSFVDEHSILHVIFVGNSPTYQADSITFDLSANQWARTLTHYPKYFQVTQNQNRRIQIMYQTVIDTIPTTIYRYQNSHGEWQEQIISEGANLPQPRFIGIDAQNQPHFILFNPATSKLEHQFIQNYSTQSGDSILSQTITIPETRPYLSFMYANNNDPSTNALLYVTISQASEATEVFSTAPEEYYRWEHAVVDLSAWAGQTVTLSFETNQIAGELRTAYYIDEVSIGTGYTDIWVQGSAVNAMPGEQVTMQVHYGNRSMVDAGSSTLTLALPAGLTLLDANPPADEPGGSTWTMDSIPAYANGVITLNLEVSAEVPLFDALIGDVSITTSDELETANNQAQLLVRVGNYLFLPLVER